MSGWVTVAPGRPRGRVIIPPSKSIGHRALICAALAEEGQVSTLYDLPCNQDIEATLDCLRALGVTVHDLPEAGQSGGRSVRVVGCGGRFEGDETLNCRESGSTLRFMLPLCLLSEYPRILAGSDRLLHRPLDDYARLLWARDARVSGGLLILGEGPALKGETYRLSGKSSSQFITGLLLALPQLPEDSEIVLAAPPESRSYIDMTLAVMARFGVRARWAEDTRLVIPGGQCYRACQMTVDGDASGAAFFQALDALSEAPGSVEVVCASGPDIVQGDSVCPALLKAILEARGPISLADCPDLAPVLFCAAAARGGAVFTHTDRLRLKESDRITAMAGELAKFGVATLVSDGEFLGPAHRRPAAEAALAALPDRDRQAMSSATGWVAILPPAEGLTAPAEPLLGHNDHRIVMALAVLAATLDDDTTPVRIEDAGAVAKSFPDFFDRLRGLGVSVEGEL